MLKEMKEKVDIDKIGILIKNLRKTAVGDVLITVRGGKEESKKLKEVIEKKNKELKVVVRKRKGTLFVRDIDAATTLEDVQKAALNKETEAEGEHANNVVV